MKFAGALMLSVCIAALFAACGGGGDDTTASTVTKAQYIRKADAICAKAIERREAALNTAYEAQERKGGFSEPPTRAELLPVITEAVVPVLARMTDELDELDEPAVDSDQADAVVDAFQAGVNKFETDPAKAAFSAKGPFDQSRERSQELGLKVCVTI